MRRGRWPLLHRTVPGGFCPYEFLIDPTDERLQNPGEPSRHRIYPARESFRPLRYRRHFRLAKLVPDAQYYCPSFSSLAYVVLHTEANLIFAIAIGMLKIDFRVSPALVSEAMGRGEAEHSDIGADW